MGWVADVDRVRIWYRDEIERLHERDRSWKVATALPPRQTATPMHETAAHVCENCGLTVCECRTGNEGDLG